MRNRGAENQVPTYIHLTWVAFSCWHMSHRNPVPERQQMLTCSFYLSFRIIASKSLKSLMHDAMGKRNAATHHRLFLGVGG